MRKAQKKQVEDFINLLSQAHAEIKGLIENQNTIAAMQLLEQCQEGAIKAGDLIEKTEGEGFITIPLLEDYCELVYQMHERIAGSQDINAGIYKKISRSLIQIENSIRNDIKVRYEIVFFPYKASMWDSLESVWRAADEDPDCDAYVIPVPYYDRNPDGTLGTYHYEKNAMPPYVPTTYYDDYCLEERRPDAIYIHNPYDDTNYVTSIEPRFYSSELKKYTECLVYIPYYATSGGMLEGQISSPAYYHADYIMIQSEKYRKFFDPALPKDKLVPLGSPKFDRVIRMCSNPPEPPAKWKEKMSGKKVYFYNTSIGGMLSDTEKFLEKMQYVFQCFKERKDACLVWRPHPLLESTFDSMRKMLRPVYDELKKYYIENEIGIYDDTSDITNTIALCDAYIGDAGTSVTSLFGMAGKPLFILNNNINAAPQKDDWRGEIIRGFSVDGQNKWIITQGNKLYYSLNNDYKYRYYCDLSEYSSGNYYLQAIEIGRKIYICPSNAQDILVIENGKIERCIQLEHLLEQPGAFSGIFHIENYLFLIPRCYPAIVRYDTVRDKVDYIKGYNDVFVSFIQGEWRSGGGCVWNNYVLLASPTDNRVLAVEGKSGNVQVLSTGAKNTCGCRGMTTNGMDVWLLPYSGTVVTCWNPATGKTEEYSDVPAGFRCNNRPYGYECKDKPFWTAAICKKFVYLSPFWGNMFLCLDKETGEMREWKPPFPMLKEGKNGYYNSFAAGYFLNRNDRLGEWTYRFFSLYDCKLYDINLETEEYKEIVIEFNQDDLKEHESGFCESSEWLQYCCEENYFNTLERFLDGNIIGTPFKKERQLSAYEKIAANNDGTSGKKIHQFIRIRL